MTGWVFQDVIAIADQTLNALCTSTGPGPWHLGHWPAWMRRAPVAAAGSRGFRGVGGGVYGARPPGRGLPEPLHDGERAPCAPGVLAGEDQAVPAALPAPAFDHGPLGFPRARDPRAIAPLPLEARDRVGLRLGVERSVAVVGRQQRVPGADAEQVAGERPVEVGDHPHDFVILLGGDQSEAP